MGFLYSLKLNGIFNVSVYGLDNVKRLVDNIINFLAKGDQWLIKKTINHNNIIKNILYALMAL